MRFRRPADVCEASGESPFRFYSGRYQKFTRLWAGGRPIVLTNEKALDGTPIPQRADAPLIYPERHTR